MGRTARTLTAGALTALAACSSVEHRDDVAARVATIDAGRLRAHVEALEAIGPRPIGDEDATAETVEWLEERLQALGFAVEREAFETRRPSSIVAQVRPADEPDAKTREMVLSDSLGPVGRHVMQAATEELREQGWEVESYEMRGADDRAPLELVNVIATLPGTDPDAPIVELSAHYDTVVLSPGADDNSSGVAVLLEVARVVADARAERTVRLCFFGAEEVGLVGSRVHLERAQERGDDLAGLINLDAVGFTREGPDTQRRPPGVPFLLAPPDEATFLAVCGDWNSGALGDLFLDAAKAYAPDLELAGYPRVGSKFPDAHRSDHAHWWEEDLPAVFLTDTAEFRSPHYHAPSDRAETLDWTFLEGVARATAATALHWARAERPPVVERD